MSVKDTVLVSYIRARVSTLDRSERVRRTRYSANRPSAAVHDNCTVPVLSSVTAVNVTAGVSSGSSGFSRLASWLQPSRASRAMSRMDFGALPLLNAGLARMPTPQLSLAAWPILYSIILFFRGPGIALPETVIALLRHAEDLPPLWRFCWWVAGVSTTLLALVTLTPVLPRYLHHVAGVSGHLADLVMTGVLVGAFIPALAAVSNMFRGILMTGRATSHVYWGMAAYFVATVIGIGAGVVLQTPGILTASLVFTTSTIVEIVYLGVNARRLQRRRWPASVPGQGQDLRRGSVS